MKAILAHEEKKKAERSPSVRGSDLSMTLPPHLPTVVEDSQPAKYPRFASQLDIMGIGDQGFEPGGTPDENLFESQLPEDLKGLFPDTPKQSRTVEMTNVSYSRSRVSSREGPNTDTPDGQKVISGNTRQPLQQQTRPRAKAVPSVDRDPNASVRRAQINASAPNPASTRSPPKSSQPQRPTQESGNAPRGILKQATQTQHSRGQKRRAADAEISILSVAGFTATKRRKSSAPTNGLGPIIVDSQSPAAGAGGRGRKQTTRHGTKSKKGKAQALGFWKLLIAGCLRRPLPANIQGVYR